MNIKLFVSLALGSAIALEKSLALKISVEARGVVNKSARLKAIAKMFVLRVHMLMLLTPNENKIFS